MKTEYDTLQICKNCKHWDYGYCDVKYNNVHTDGGQQCDEVLAPAMPEYGYPKEMFFTPIDK